MLQQPLFWWSSRCFFIPLLEFALVHSPLDQCLRLVQSWSAMHRFYSNSLRCSWLTTGSHLTGRVYAHFLWCVLILFLPQCHRITITRLWFAHPVSTRFNFCLASTPQGSNACSHSNPESSSSSSHVFCFFSSFCFLSFSFQFPFSFFAQNVRDGSHFIHTVAPVFDLNTRPMLS